MIDPTLHSSIIQLIRTHRAAGYSNLAIMNFLFDALAKLQGPSWDEKSRFITSCMKEA